MPGCADMVTRLPPPLFFRVTWAGQRSAEWIRLVTDGENSQVGVWLFGGALSGSSAFFFLHLLHLQAGFRRDRSLQLGRSPHCLRVLVHTCMSEARLSGHNLESGAGHCLINCGRAIAPLMKPWCAEGDVPTAANLNLYRGRSSHVGYSDDEPLFGECGEAKHCFSELWEPGAFQMEGKQ